MATPRIPESRQGRSKGFSCYRTKLESTHPTRSKTKLLTLGYGEGKYGVYCKAPDMGPNKENWQLTLERPNSLMEFREGFF